ncbi:MAG: sugar-binding protein [Armatimonadota bacterium]
MSLFPQHSLFPARITLSRWVLVLAGLLALCTAVSAAEERYFIPLAAAGAVKVDGSLNEWGALGSSVLIDQDHLGGGYFSPPFNGPKDCQARVRLAYDAKNLYIALSVTDNSVVPLEKKSGVPGKFWEQDGMGLYLDVPGANVVSGRYNTKPTRPWQQEPIIQLTPSTNNFAAETLPEGSKYGCVIAKDGYAVEASVPWASLGWQPVAGDRIFFAAILADYDRGADGKLGPLRQIIWHQGSSGVIPASRDFAQARLLSAGGYGAEVLTASQVAIKGSRWSWKMLVDAAKPGWQVTQVNLVGEGTNRSLLSTRPGPITPSNQQLLTGDIDTSALKPGVYVVVATATNGAQTEKTQQPLNVVDGSALALQYKSAQFPQQYYIPDPLRSGTMGGVNSPIRPITHADYFAYVKQECEAAWPSVEYHLKAKTLSLGGGWYDSYALRYAAYAKVTKDPVWIQRAQGLFELANDAYKANNYAGLGWINLPLVYYTKQYLTAVNAWKPEYDGMVKEWCLHTVPAVLKGTHYRGMNNWGLSFGACGIIGKYWLGDALPDKAEWDKQIAETWGVFFNDIRDIDENTTNYAPWDLWLILTVLDMNGQTNRLKTDAKLRYLFERYIYEISPSGGRPQYGSTNGWHDGGAIWMYIFERVGQITGDGRYKYQARRIWDYSVKHVEDWHQYHLVSDSTTTFLTRLLAEVPDDLPEQPIEAKSLITLRGDMIPLSPEERIKRNEWISTTANPVPNKIIFRGNNASGSMWAMVEMNGDAGHCSARPTSVNCLMDKETVLLSSQGYYEQEPQFHNMVLIEDLEGTQGVQPLMKITAPIFQDGKNVTYAVAEVERYMRWPVTLRRHYLFAKDRFFWVRDELTFNSTFFARIGPCWLSRQMGPVSGKDWVNTYFDSMPYTGLGQGNGHHKWKNYNYDLLTYFVPRTDMELSMSDLTSHNQYMNAPLRVRQVWRGLAKQGQTMAFDSLLIPHAVKYKEPDATWLAKTIKPLANDPKQTAMQFELPWRKEKVVVVTTDKPFTGGGITTDAKMAMVVFQGDKVVNWYVYQGTILKAGDNVLFSNATPADGER